MTREEFKKAHNWLMEKDGYPRINWCTIGEWVFPTAANDMKSQVFYHICDGNRADPSHIHKEHGANISERLDPDKCEACGTPVPEGLKMVVMLLGSNI